MKRDGNDPSTKLERASPATFGLDVASAAVLAAILVAPVWSGCSLEYLVEGTASSTASATGVGGGGAGAGGDGGAGLGGAGGEAGGGPSNDVWGFAYGSAEDQQEGTAVAVDRTCPDGGCPVLVGFFADSLDLGGEVLTAVPATPEAPADVDIFVAKFDADGKHLWSKDFGDDREQRADSVAVDGSGNVLVTGYFRGEIDFAGGMPLTSEPLYRNDVFVAKLAPDGSHLWSKQYGGKSDGTDDQHQQGRVVVTDAMDDIYVAGTFAGSVTFDGVQHTATDAQDAFLVKLSAAGDRLWSIAWDGAGNSSNAPTVAVDDVGAVFLAGNFTSVLDFGCEPPLSGGDDENAFVAKLDGPTGDCLWAKQYGDGSSGQVARALAPVPGGDVVVAFEINGNVDFGAGNLSGNSRDMVVARLPGDGASDAVWTLRAVDPKEQFVAAAGVASDGAVLVAGSFLESLTVDPSAPAWKVISKGESDVFLVRLLPDGTLSWAQAFGRYANDFGRGVAVDNEGNALLTGSFRGSIDFGQTELASNQREQDIFLAKFRPDPPAE